MENLESILDVPHFFEKDYGKGIFVRELDSLNPFDLMDLDSAYKITHDSYVSEFGYVDPKLNDRYVDSYDDLGKSKQFVVYKNDSVVGRVRLIGNNRPIEQELDAFNKRKLFNFPESSKLVIEPKSRRNPRIMLALMNTLYLNSKKSGGILCSSFAERESFYKGLGGKKLCSFHHSGFGGGDLSHVFAWDFSSLKNKLANGEEVEFNEKFVKKYVNG